MPKPDPSPTLPELPVLHVLSNFGIGGAEVWLIALLRYFREHAKELGIQVQMDVVLTHGFRDRLDDEAESLGARLIYARYSRKTLPQFIQTWRRTLKTGGYHAVHDHQEFTAGWHFLFGTGLLPPVRIAHLHNPMSHQRSYGSGWLRRRTISLGNRLIAARGTHLLSTSRQLIREQGFDDLPAAKHLTKRALHCGFDPKRFWGDRAVARRDVLDEFKLPTDTKLMLFVGRLDSSMDETRNQKNPSFCLEVARECAARDSNFHCLLAGGGDAMRERLTARVTNWGLKDRIRLIGSRSDVPCLMHAADLLLFPSFAEGLGMVAVEAQAAGLPVLASDGVPKECAVVPGMVEFLPLSAGAQQWADRALSLIATSKLDHRVAYSSVERSPFAIQNSARALLDIYNFHEPIFR